jgi:tetratricopeptide (TPR) repeat protein
MWGSRLGASLVISLGLVSAPVYAQLSDSAEYADAKGLIARKKWDEAVIALRKLYRDEQGSSEIVNDLTRALTYSGRREEALSFLGHAISRRQGAARSALIRKSRVLSRLFLTQTTQQNYQDGLGLALSRKYKLARERFEKSLEIEPDNVEILLRLGQCLVLENDFDSAAERLKLARKLNPHEPQIHLWLGKALKERGEINEALDELKSAYTQLSVSELAAAWYGDTLAQSNGRPAAFKILEKDLSEHPRHLLTLATYLRLRVSGSLDERTDAQTLRALRQKLEDGLALSEQYRAGLPEGGVDELGIDLRDEKEIRQQLETIRDRLDARLDRIKDKNPASTE